MEVGADEEASKPRIGDGQRIGKPMGGGNSKSMEVLDMYTGWIRGQKLKRVPTMGVWRM
jgi:hypothetical protein